MLTYAAIIRAVWGYSDYGSVKKLQVNMRNILKKMGVTPGEKRYIINYLQPVQLTFFRPFSRKSRTSFSGIIL